MVDEGLWIANWSTKRSPKFVVREICLGDPVAKRLNRARRFQREPWVVHESLTPRELTAHGEFAVGLLITVESVGGRCRIFMRNSLSIDTVFQTKTRLSVICS
jgi:hypothetical protein